MRRAERRPLTEQFIRSVSTPGMYYDSGETQQLALRVKKSGAKLWVVYRRWRGKPSRRRLGTTAEYSLAEAREVCRAWCAMAARRLDPAMEAARERAATFACSLRGLLRGGGSHVHRRADGPRLRYGGCCSRSGADAPFWRSLRKMSWRLFAQRFTMATGHRLTMLLATPRVLRWAFHEGSRYGLTSNLAAAVTPTAIVGTSRAMRQRVLSDPELSGSVAGRRGDGLPVTKICMVSHDAHGMSPDGGLRHELERGRHSSVALDDTAAAVQVAA